VTHLLVTGGAGFIGSAYVREVLARRDGSRITVLDKLTYAGNESNLDPVLDDPDQAARLRFVRGDIADPAVVGNLVADADAVVNFAAETHVDRSILEPQAFLVTNVIGVHTCSRPSGPRIARTEDPLRPGLDGRGLRLDPDGPLGRGRSLHPRSPYAPRRRPGAARASYHVTYGVDAVDHPRLEHVRPFHHPEKLIRCSSRTRSTTGRCRSTGTGSSGATGCTSPITPRRSISCSATVLPGETYNVAGGRS
jgi:dTDP-glucose 4,6-dehydratase